MACVALIAVAAEPTAWLNSSWGMSAADLKSAFAAGLIVDLPETTATLYKLKSGEERAHIGIPSFDLVGSKFRVVFLTDPKGLHQVNMNVVDRALASETLFHTLEEAIAVKYGRPLSRSSDNGSNSQWQTKTSVIQLDYINLKLIHFTDLTLTYVPIPAAADQPF